MRESRVTEKPSLGAVPKTSLSEDHDIMMRRYIRHPSTVPIEFDVVEEGKHSCCSEMVNISRGGLCFHSKVAIPESTRVHLEIPIDSPPFEVEGNVAWCKLEDSQFLVGIAFDDRSSAYSVRMVEQVCYIEHYRRWVKQSEGRELSSEQAAQEWVELYAADFPKH